MNDAPSSDLERRLESTLAQRAASIAGADLATTPPPQPSRSARLAAIAASLLLVAAAGWVAASRSGGSETTETRSAPELSAAPTRTTSPAPPELTEPRSPATTAPHEDQIATLVIGALGLELPVYPGIGPDALKRGVGHDPRSALPGSDGNVAIAGHRTVYGAPFADLDHLVPGEPLLLITEHIRTYIVEEVRVVDPTADDSIEPTTDNRLTLTTEHPRFSDRERLVVVAVELRSDQAAPLRIAPGECRPSSESSGFEPRPPNEVEVHVLEDGEGTAVKRLAECGYVITPAAREIDTTSLPATPTIFYRPGYLLEAQRVAALLALDETEDVRSLEGHPTDHPLSRLAASATAPVIVVLR